MSPAVKEILLYKPLCGMFEDAEYEKRSVLYFQFMKMFAIWGGVQGPLKWPNCMRYENDRKAVV